MCQEMPEISYSFQAYSSTKISLQIRYVSQKAAYVVLPLLHLTTETMLSKVELAKAQPKVTHNKSSLIHTAIFIVSRVMDKLAEPLDDHNGSIDYSRLASTWSEMSLLY